MSTDALRDELLAVAGVADAEVDGPEDTPSGVRVRLAPEADPEIVGQAVQRILSSHGVRSRVGPPFVEATGPPPPPGAPGEVVAMADFESSEVRRRGRPGNDENTEAPRAVLLSPVVTAVTLEALAVQETKDGVLVTAAASDGRQATRRARWTGGGLDEAVIAAVAELAGEEAPPLVIGVQQGEIDETQIVSVLLERGDGRRVVGAAIVEAGAPFALARAAWVALAAPE